MHQATTDARAGQMIATTVQQHLAVMAAPLPEMPTAATAPTRERRRRPPSPRPAPPERNRT